LYYINNNTNTKITNLQDLLFIKVCMKIKIIWTLNPNLPLKYFHWILVLRYKKIFFLIYIWSFIRIKEEIKSVQYLIFVFHITLYRFHVLKSNSSRLACFVPIPLTTFFNYLQILMDIFDLFILCQLLKKELYLKNLI